MNTQQLVDTVTELAMEIDMANPLDFGMMEMSEADTFRYVATSVIESAFKEAASVQEVNLMLLATATHLVVENMILNQRILSLINNTGA